jgi:hypothetical protein
MQTNEMGFLEVEEGNLVFDKKKMNSAEGNFFGKRIIRVFPKRTTYTPDDALVAISRPPGLFDEADEVHISASFTWDMPVAEQLYNLWKCVAPVKIGGPATGERGEEFVPGMYVKLGKVITSRGCPNKCWFCQVWRRDGGVRELPITNGWDVLDDNLFACSDAHIKAVFSMLSKQPFRPTFGGGLEAARLTPWIAKALYDINVEQMFFAYDTPDDLEPLILAGKLLSDVGFSLRSNPLRCYVLCGYKGDMFEAAEKRMLEAWSAGFMPFAMVYASMDGVQEPNWRRWSRLWCRPAGTRSLLKQLTGTYIKKETKDNQGVLF